MLGENTERLRNDRQTGPAAPAIDMGTVVMNGLWRFRWLDDVNYELLFEPDDASTLPRWPAASEPVTVMFENAHEMLGALMTRKARLGLRLRPQLNVFGRAKITADRWSELLKTASVSEQETAEKKSDYALKQANLDAAQANYNRLEQLKNFARVTAPFTGTITARNTDIGQLIAAGSGPELFRMAQTDPLRIYVRVPQTMIRAIAAGQKAELIFQERAGENFTATVMRTAGAVDPDSRTLLVELQVPNPHNDILAGSYAQVRFNHAADTHGLMISDNALIFRAQGMQVALVGDDNKVQLRPVKVGRDYGDTIEILNGIKATDRVIVNPPDSIADGMSVQVAPAAEDKAKP